ncbi:MULTISPECIES: phage head spike fiber domain-containing protein [Cupriavidus]
MLVSKNFGDIVTFMRASVGWSYSPAGVLVPNAANSPRLDYDPITLAARGLLVEEQRTNLALNSDTFTNWNIQGATLSAPMMAAPDGGLSRKLVSAVTPSTVVQVYQTSANTPTTVGASYTLSVFAKAGEYAAAYLNTNLVGNFGSAVFDLTNGATKASAGLTASMVQLGNGWWRCSAAGVAANTGTQIAVGGASDFAGASPGTGPAGNSVFDGVSGLYVWRVQFEQGAFSTSAIPTTSAQATRAADGAIIADLNKIGFNASEGTFYAEWVVPNDTGNHAPVALSDGSANNRLALFTGAGQVRATVNVSGATVLTLNGPAVAAGALCKAALGYSAAGHALCANGGAAVTGAGAVPVVNQMAIGQTQAFTSMLGSTIRALRYIPRRMTNAELQALTV